MVERQEKDLGRLQVDLDELEEKSRSTQAALDSAYRYEICSVFLIWYYSRRLRNSLFFIFKNYFVCVVFCLRAYLCATCPRRPDEVVGSLEL